MKSVLKKIFVTLIYLTPVGYLLSLFHLYSGERTPGVYVNLSKEEPVRVIVKQNPQVIDRIHWFVNGGVLIVQAIIIIYKDLGGDWGHTYAWIALIFGVVNTISAIFPNLNWNNKLSKSIVWIVIIISLIFTVAYLDVFQLLLNNYE